MKVEKPVTVYTVDYFDNDQKRRVATVRSDQQWKSEYVRTMLAHLINAGEPRHRKVSKIINVITTEG